MELFSTVFPVSVRDHRRGVGDPLGARSQPAVEDARPKQGRDRADETEVSSLSFHYPLFKQS